MYTRYNPSTFFLIPTLAIGIDETVPGRPPFIEVAWGFWAIGIGDFI